MLFEDHPLLCYEPDKNYPKIMLDESGKLKYRKITFQNLHKCISTAQYHLENNLWTTITAKAYLKAEGLHQKSIDRITKLVEYNDVDHYQTPMYIQSDLPFSWYNYNDTHGYVDAPMHLLM